MTTTSVPPNIAAILGRPEHAPEIETPLRALQDHRVLVTGAAGSIGAALTGLMKGLGLAVIATDAADCDVTDRGLLTEVMAWGDPTLIFHLAGAKHAPEGETDPIMAARTNITGTANVVRTAPARARVITASTCKACDPETAYGATKLIAERVTLNAGGSVARFFNVPESSGNVFGIWRSVETDEPIPVVAGCTRRFVSLREALALLLWTAILPPARYIIHPGEPRNMTDVAMDLYPDRELTHITRRRGDRLDEPLHARSEQCVSTEIEHLLRVVSPHDPRTEGTQ